MSRTHGGEIEAEAARDSGGTPGVSAATPAEVSPARERGRGGRIAELDAVRGLAALTVVVGHFMIAFPMFAPEGRDDAASWLVTLLKETPLAIFSSGNAAVTLFFVLSGFVLALPFFADGGMPYRQFLLKRVFRLYIPYIGAVAVAIGLMALAYNGPESELSDWFNDRWRSLSLASVLGHGTLIGTFPDADLNPVVWSLVHEMRISIVFPALVLLVDRFGWTIGAVLSAVLCGLAYKATPILGGSGEQSDYLVTVQYVPCFVAGIVLARHREAVVE